MASVKGYDRLAWEDRFNRPDAPRLRAALKAAPARLFDHLRQHLLSLNGVTEGYAWHGDCWRWTIEYRTRHSDQPLAVLVPSPADLQLAMPMEPEFIRSLPMRRMKRSLKEGVGLAQEPFDTRWAVWSVQADGILDDLVDLLEMKMRHLAKHVG